MKCSELHKIILIKFMHRPDQDVFPTGCSSAAGHPGRGTPALGRVQVFLVRIMMSMIMMNIPGPWESPGPLMLVIFSQDYDEHAYYKDPLVL